MTKIKVLVADDEPLARERLTGLLSQEPDIEVVGQARDGEEAITAIHDDTPDLVFLDVQMPQMNGFEVIEAVGTDKMPLVIFVTAYDQHALKAFQVRALDYLLKPFDRERFKDALQRARKQLEREENGDLGRRLLALVKDLRRDQPKSDRLVVKSGGRLFFLRTDEIDWVEAAGQLRPPPRRPWLPSAARNDERDRRTARSGEVLPHPPLPHRQHGADPGAAALAERRICGAAADRHPAHAQPRLPGEAAGPARTGTLNSILPELPCESDVTAGHFRTRVAIRRLWQSWQFRAPRAARPSRPTVFVISVQFGDEAVCPRGVIARFRPETRPAFRLL